jgi:molecular chaperone DnaK (HSP70)
VFWGYGIPDPESRASWIKLLLLDDKDLPADLRASDQFIATKKFLISTRAGSGTDLVSEYLLVFWSHIIGSITQALGEEAVEASQLKIVVTIPAIWPHYAQSRMAAAVEEAGITTNIRGTSLTFMSEPEAAALSNFYDDRRYMQQRLAVNDTFVICDAGGGTVDLIAYRVIECTSSGLEIEEVMPGKGKLCGATFLDAAFEKLLLSHFGEGWKTADLDERQRVMEDAWERRIKPDFDGNDTFARLDVQVPASCRYHVRQSERQRKLTDPFCSSYTFTR